VHSAGYPIVLGMLRGPANLGAACSFRQTIGILSSPSSSPEPRAARPTEARRGGRRHRRRDRRPRTPAASSAGLDAGDGSSRKTPRS
jgi:hypothetical protein